MLTTTESDNQVLCNAFFVGVIAGSILLPLVWKKKCVSFGMKKVGPSSRQAKPSQFISNHRIPSVSIGGSYAYLGRSVSFDINSEIHKAKLDIAISGTLYALTL